LPPSRNATPLWLSLLPRATFSIPPFFSPTIAGPTVTDGQAEWEPENGPRTFPSIPKRARKHVLPKARSHFRASHEKPRTLGKSRSIARLTSVCGTRVLFRVTFGRVRQNETLSCHHGRTRYMDVAFAAGLRPETEDECRSHKMTAMGDGTSELHLHTSANTRHCRSRSRRCAPGLIAQNSRFPALLELHFPLGPFYDKP